MIQVTIMASGKITHKRSFCTLDYFREWIEETFPNYVNVRNLPNGVMLKSGTLPINIFCIA